MQFMRVSEYAEKLNIFINVVYIRFDSEYTMRIWEIYVLLQAHICMKPHVNHITWVLKGS